MVVLLLTLFTQEADAQQVDFTWPQLPTDSICNAAMYCSHFSNITHRQLSVM